MSADTINIDHLMGSVEVVQVQEVRGSQLWMGGYSISRDRNGLEVSRTPVTWHCYAECHTARDAASFDRASR